MADATNYGSAASGVGKIVDDIGSVYSSILSRDAAGREISAYEDAARLANQNQYITETSMRVQGLAQDRQIVKVEGQQGAAVGHAGFSFGGSATDIYRSSVEQGQLAKSLTIAQGTIQKNAYIAQEDADKRMADAARAKKDAAAFGVWTGAFKTVLDVAQTAVMM